MGDVNAREGDARIGSMVEKWSVSGTNNNGVYLVDVCSEMRLFLTNISFQNKMIHRYIWRRRVKRDK